jgi:hypothetical protein
MTRSDIVKILREHDAEFFVKYVKGGILTVRIAVEEESK